MKTIFSPKTKKVLFFDWNHRWSTRINLYKKHFVSLLDEFGGRWAHDGEWNPSKLYHSYEKEWKKIALITP